MAQQNLDSKNTSYDDFPYPSMPLPNTRPEHLRTIGKIFGMTPPPLEEARILELGCSSGENLFHFALNFPKAKLVGIDLSKTQIENGKKKLLELGLKNLELLNISINEIDKSFDKFDYIICHGVFSWVPEKIREKILDITKNNLTPNGIAYISYNALPGWNMQNTIKDMMRFHSSLFEGAQEKLTQSVLFLDFISEALNNNKTPYSNFLENELGSIKKQNPIHILHEYLLEDNKAFYFNDFINKAKKHGLAYLGDSSIPGMYSQNLGDKISNKLVEVVDIVESEQYMDFFTNRKFRSTLLCHDHIQLHHNTISLDIFDESFIGALVNSAILLRDANLDNNTNIEFTILDIYGTTNTLSTSSKVIKAMLYTLMANVGYPVSIHDMINSIIKKLNGSITFEIARKEILQNLPHLIFCGLIDISFSSPLYINKIFDKPKVSKLVRYEASQCQEWVTNQYNTSVKISAFSMLALRYMDGKYTLEEILDKLVDHVVKNELVMHLGEKVINTDRDQIKDLLLPSMHDHLSMCIIQRLLVA